MSHVDPRETGTQPLDDGLRIDAVCDRFEADRRAGRRPRIEDYLGEVNETGRPRLLRELVALEVELRLHDKETVTADEYLARFPALDAHWLSTLVAASPKTGAVPSTRARKIRCPHCHNPINLIEDKSDEVLCPGCGSSFTVRDARHTDTTTGTRPLGKYQLLERVGLGAFGAVWKARDTELDRIVALKIPHTGLLTNDAELERFKREARAAAQLRHPGIVTVYDVETLDGLPTIVADFIAGMPLRDLLQTRRLTFHEAATLVADIAEAVHYAHTLKVVHRDLKPANILISISRRSRSGAGLSSTESEGVHGDAPARLREPGLNEMTPLITDFGLALRDEAEVTMTLDGHIIGTPAYMSPEQAAGKGHAADARSDVYSLGVIFYELLTGELPFRGSRVAMITQVMHEEPRPPRKVKDKIPRDLETVCLKCLRKEPGRRYQTARELAEDLRRWLGGEPVLARPVGALERGWRWCRRNPGIAAITALAVLFLVTGTAVSAYFAAREHSAAVAEKENADRADLEAKNAKDYSEWADEARKLAGQRLYVSQMNLAQRAWEENRIDVLLEFLEDQKPDRTAGVDHRGFEWHFWKARSNQELFTLKGHTGTVTGVTFSVDGRRLATASVDNTARTWDVASGKELLSFRGHAECVEGVAFSPDGFRIATASRDHTARVWDAASGEVLLTLKGHTDSVENVTFSADGLRLATASEDCTARVWDAASGEVLLILKGHTASVKGVAFSADGRRIATASRDNTARVWDAANGELQITLKGHKAPIDGLAFSPDGRRIATASWDKTARMWDATSGQALLTIKGHSRGLTSVAFSPDGRRIATASRDNTARVWDAPSGDELLTVKGHTFDVLGVAFSPDGRRIATASETARMWDAASGQVFLTLSGHKTVVTAVAITPDGSRIATASWDKTARVWDAASGEVLLTLRGHTEVLNGLALSPDGHRIATASRDFTARVWDAASGQVLLTLKGHTDHVNGVAFSPDCRRIATASRDFTARVWDAASGDELLTLKGHSRDVTGVAFSPDGHRLATGSNDGTARVWDASSGQLLLTITGPKFSGNGVAFSPDGRRLATGSLDGPARVWDATSGQLLFTLKGHTTSVQGVAFSPDGRRILTSSSDSTARVWDAANGQELLTLKGHAGAVQGAAFSPDGRRILTSSYDGTARVWEAEVPTAEQRHARFLVGVVRAIWDQVRGRDELLKRIREDKFLSDDERKQALTFAERYPEKK